MPNKPLVSAAELEALVQDWGAVPNKSVDRFFPLRFWFVFLIAAFYCLYLLFWPENVARRMTTDPNELIKMGKFLYFRGWFLLIALAYGTYAYLKGWYTALVFSSLLIAGCVNFLFDLFNVYYEAMANPTPVITLMLIVRLTALWFVYLSIKNSSRLPEVKDRLNIALLFRKNS